MSRTTIDPLEIKLDNVKQPELDRVAGFTAFSYKVFSTSNFRIQNYQFCSQRAPPNHKNIDKSCFICSSSNIRSLIFVKIHGCVVIRNKILTT